MDLPTFCDYFMYLLVYLDVSLVDLLCLSLEILQEIIEILTVVSKAPSRVWHLVCAHWMLVNHWLHILSMVSMAEVKAGQSTYVLLGSGFYASAFMISFKSSAA